MSSARGKDGSPARRENLNVDGLGSGSSQGGLVKERLSMQPYKVNRTSPTNKASNMMGPFAEPEITKPEKAASAISYHSTVTANEPTVMETARAATVLRQVQRAKEDNSLQRSFQVQQRKASMEQPSRNGGPKGGNRGLSLNEEAIKLPNLGRTVTHSMTPAAFRSQNGLMKGPGGAEVDMADALAKRSFLRVDERALADFRKHGKTPTARQMAEIRLKGELTPDQVKPGATSPLSQRASEGGPMLGAMGTITAVSRLPPPELFLLNMSVLMWIASTGEVLVADD